MGCDIHDYAEIRKEGSWHAVGDVFANPYFDASHQESSRNVRLSEHPFRSRNYDVFAILADVRNERNEKGGLPDGYACDDGFEPISRPRGLPADVCALIGSRAHSLGVDGHSHSWLDLHDLCGFDWSRSTRKELWVQQDGYRDWKEHGRPRRGFRNSNYPKGSHADVDADLAAGRRNERCTLVEWTEVYSTSAREFLERTLPALLALIVPDGWMGQVRGFLDDCRDGGGRVAALMMEDWLAESGLPSLRDVRIVFWFDN